MILPTILHRIWFGGEIPIDYQQYLLNLKTINSETYEVWLWSDFDNLSVEESNYLHTFCEVNGIRCLNIRDHDSLHNFDLITQELDLAKNRAGEIAFQPKLHFARASDLARVAILIQHGGVYTDTDTEAVRALPQLNSVYGVLCKLKKVDLFEEEKVELEKTYPDYTGLILYDFMAACQDNPVMIAAAEISRLDYQTYNKIKQDDWEFIPRADFHLEMTVMLSGTALRLAVNYFTQSHNISFAQAQCLFFDDTPYFTTYYDKSWLTIDEKRFFEGNVESRNAYYRQFIVTSKVDDKILERIRNGLKESRRHYFFPLDTRIMSKYEIIEDEQTASSIKAMVHS
jgi:hypothetical protein